MYTIINTDLVGILNILTLIKTKGVKARMISRFGSNLEEVMQRYSDDQIQCYIDYGCDVGSDGLIDYTNCTDKVTLIKEIGILNNESTELTIDGIEHIIEALEYDIDDMDYTNIHNYDRLLTELENLQENKEEQYHE
jgi:hypothetical protein